MDNSIEVTPPEKAWVHCLKIEATVKTGDRMCMNRRHDSHLLHFGQVLGFKTLLADIRSHDFRFLDYFYRSGGSDYSVWLQKAREREREREKAPVTEDPRISEMVAGLAKGMKA